MSGSFAAAQKERFGSRALLGALIIASAFSGGSAASAQDEPPTIREVRVFDPDFALPHAAGLAYSPVANVFLMLADPSTAPVGREAHNLTMISPDEHLVGTANLPVIANPINSAFDSRHHRYLMFDTAEQELIAVQASPDGYPDPAAVRRFEALPFDVENPQGMTVDPVNGALYMLSAANAQIVRILPDLQGGFDGAAALAEGRISQIDLRVPGQGPFRGLAFNPTNEHLYTLDPVRRNLYEISTSGQLVAARELSVLDLGFRDPQGIVFAPSADRTDDPAQLHLFLMDSGLGPLSTGPLKNAQPLPQNTLACQEVDPSEANQRGPAKQGPGRIIELSLTRPIDLPDR